MPQIIIKDGIMTVAAFPIKVGRGTVSYEEPMKYQMYHKREKDEFWIGTTLFYNDLGKAACEAEDCAKDKIKYGGTAIRERKTKHWIVRFPSGGDHPEFTWEPHSKEVMLALQHKADVKVEKKDSLKGCPDCTDGFYYPLFGPKEPCKTCAIQTHVQIVKSADFDPLTFLQQFWDKLPWGKGPNPIKANKPKFAKNIKVFYRIQFQNDFTKDHLGYIIDRLADEIIIATQKPQATEVFFTQKDYPDFIVEKLLTGVYRVTTDLTIGFL